VSRAGRVKLDRPELKIFEPRRREEREERQKIISGSKKQRIKDFLRDLRVFAVNFLSLLKLT
jgi:hypothetical protein